MTSPVISSEQRLALTDEVSTAIRLLTHGLGELQRIDGANDFYHVPILTLASGFERLMKAILCLETLQRTGVSPRSGEVFRGRKGHDLEFLLQGVMSRCLTTEYRSSRGAGEQDYIFLSSDVDFRKLLGILSRFGQADRYYNLDLVLGRTPLTESPEREWARFELMVLRRTPDWAQRLQTPNGLDEA